MAALTVAGFGVGALYYPPRDVDAPLPPPLQVVLPDAIYDGLAWWPLADFQWREVPVEGSTRIIITTTFGKPQLQSYEDKLKSKDAPIEFKVYLPDNAKTTELEGESDLLGNSPAETSQRKTRWQAKDCDNETVFDHRPTRPCLQVNGVVNNVEPFFVFHFDVTGVSSLNLATNRTRATIRYPLVLLDHQLKSPFVFSGIPPFRESVQAFVPNEDKFTWSTQPYDEAGGFLVTWSDKSDNISPAAIKGVREDALRQDARHEFLSGISFGVGGAAFIGIAQSLFTACRKRNPRKTDRTCREFSAITGWPTIRFARSVLTLRSLPSIRRFVSAHKCVPWFRRPRDQATSR